MKRFILTAAASLAALAVAQPAAADVTRAVYVGVFDIYDETGYIGYGTGSYQKYGTLTFLFDSDTYRAQYDTTTRTGFPEGNSNLQGSGEFSPGKGYVTIGDFSSGFIGQASPSGSNDSFFYKSDSPGFDDFQQSANLWTYDPYGYSSQKNLSARAYSYEDDFLSSIDPDDPFGYTPDYANGWDYINGSFSIYNSNPDAYVRVWGSFTPTSVTVTNLSGAALRTSGLSSLAVAAVPEPSTWAMMLLGFGAVGAVLRRRRAPAGGMPVPARA
jgi:hypothetical protein